MILALWFDEPTLVLLKRSLWMLGKEELLLRTTILPEAHNALEKCRLPINWAIIDVRPLWFDRSSARSLLRLLRLRGVSILIASDCEQQKDRMDCPWCDQVLELAFSTGAQYSLFAQQSMGRTPDLVDLIHAFVNTAYR